MPILSQERNDRNELGGFPFWQEFTVGSDGDGGINTYYPVRYRKRSYEAETRMDSVQVFRSYNDPGPSAHGTTKGGLSSYWHGTDGAWDGGPSYYFNNDIIQTYRRTLGGAERWSGGNRDIFFLLRGGGYQYTLRSTTDFTLTIYYSETQIYRYSPDGRTWFAVPRSESQISSLLTLGPATTLGEHYSATQWTNTQR